MAALCLSVCAYIVPNISGTRKEDPVLDYLTKKTTKDDDVLLIRMWPDYYLASDRSTENKFFYQVPPVEISQELYSEFMPETEGHMPDFILVQGKKQEFLEGSGNLSKYIRFLEEYTREGNYQYEEYNDFFVYKIFESLG